MIEILMRYGIFYMVSKFLPIKQLVTKVKRVTLWWRSLADTIESDPIYHQ